MTDNTRNQARINTERNKTRYNAQNANYTPNWSADSMRGKTAWNGKPSTWRPPSSRSDRPDTLRGQVIPPRMRDGANDTRDHDYNGANDTRNARNNYNNLNNNNLNIPYYNYQNDAATRREIKPNPEKIEERRRARAERLRVILGILKAPVNFIAFLFQILRDKIKLHAARVRESKAREQEQVNAFPVWFRHVLFILLSLCLGAAVTAAMESVCAGSSGKMRTWALKYTDNFMLTAVLYAVIACLVGALSDRLWLGGALVSLAALALSLTDYFKQSIDGAPLVLADFGLADRAGAVADIAGSLWPPGIFWQAALDLLFCVIFIFYCDSIIKTRNGAHKIRPRVGRVILSGLICLFLISGSCAGIVGDLFQVDVITRLDPVSSHNTYGLTVSLWRDRVLRDKKPPEGYGADFMRGVLRRIDNLLTAPPDNNYNNLDLNYNNNFNAIYNPSYNAPYITDDDYNNYNNNDYNGEDNLDLDLNLDAPKKPNVIVILSESFFDMTKLPGVGYDRDPLENYHALQSESISGRFYSHYLGYGTGYIEMAMQTGLSGPDLGAATNICFMDDNIYKRLDSLPEQFTKTGEYKAEMLHGYDNSLYNRIVTYPLLGYSKILFEKDLLNLDLPFGGSQFAGYYLRDDYLFTALTEELKAVNQTGQRGFFYVITMGNHQPYRADKWESEIKASSRLLNASEIAILESGLEGVVKADQALGGLIENLRAYPEPTIVAFFGDHRPNLVMPDGENVYTHLGMIPGSDITAWTPEQIGEIYSTDYLIWANDPELLQGQAGTTRPSGVLSLGADILNLTGQLVSRYWALLKQTARVQLVGADIYFVDGQGVSYRREDDAHLSATDQELLYLRECVLYDAIYGEQAITREMSQPPPG